MVIGPLHAVLLWGGSALGGSTVGGSALGGSTVGGSTPGGSTPGGQIHPRTRGGALGWTSAKPQPTPVRSRPTGRLSLGGIMAALPSALRRRGLGQLGVRARLVLVAVVVVFVALVAGGGALIYILQEDLKSSATAGATARAGQVADLIRFAGVAQAAASLRE